MLKIVPLNNELRPWANDVLEREWGPPGIVSRGKMHQTKELSGIIGIENNNPIGILLYRIEKHEFEIIALNSFKEKTGIGTALIESATRQALVHACQRIFVITTNDNTYALHFYQKRGFHIKAFYPNAVGISRKLKPTIPMTGMDKIPIRDEIELEKLLQ